MAVALLASSCAAPSTRKEVIHVRAEDGMVNLSAAWAEAYMRKNPGVLIELSGTGPGRYSLKTLERADIVATMRPLLPTNSVSR